MSAAKTKEANKEIKVYSSPMCSSCEKAKAFLKENNIAFTEIDVSKDRKAAMEVVSKTGQMSIPIIQIDEKYLVGFDKGALKGALGIN